MRITGSGAWGSALLAVVLAGLGVGGCGNGYNNGVGPGPTPQPGSEFVFVPDANNNILNVLVIGPDGSFNNGPVPLIGTGVAPVWAAVDPNNQFVYVTNFNGNTVSAFTLNTTSGVVAGIGSVAAGTQPGAVAVDPSGKFAYVANDVGTNLPGSVSAYSIGATGALTAAAGSPFAAGTNPQQGIAATTVAGMEFVYVTNFGSSNVSAYSLNTGTGVLTPLATSPFATGSGPVSLAMDPASRFLFTANSNTNNVSAFTVNADGSLTAVPGSPFPAGNSPQYLVTDRTGTHLYVVNVNDNSVEAYTIAANGALTVLNLYSTGFGPEGLAVDAANKFLMVANCGDGTLSGFSINGDGTLTQLVGSPFFLGGCPQAVATTH